MNSSPTTTSPSPAEPENLGHRALFVGFVTTTTLTILYGLTSFRINTGELELHFLHSALFYDTAQGAGYSCNCDSRHPNATHHSDWAIQGVFSWISFGKLSSANGHTEPRLTREDVGSVWIDIIGANVCGRIFVSYVGLASVEITAAFSQGSAAVADVIIFVAESRYRVRSERDYLGIVVLNARQIRHEKGPYEEEFSIKREPTAGAGLPSGILFNAVDTRVMSPSSP
ncbi:hypothetical protein BU15DRAFT_80245 [Melanogaster broomeanus]|nr:hypothetical protein BU15DRAFT_80245 [Melanogaster broomeanus]